MGELMDQGVLHRIDLMLFGVKMCTILHYRRSELRKRGIIKTGKKDCFVVTQLFELLGDSFLGRPLPDEPDERPQKPKTRREYHDLSVDAAVRDYVNQQTLEKLDRDIEFRDAKESVLKFYLHRQ